MKIALASAPVINRDIDYNLNIILRTMEGLSGHADLVLFGESVLQGFDCLIWDYETDRKMAVTQDDPAINQLRDAARQYGVAVSFGYIEAVDETLYSSQLVIDAAGRIVHNFHRVSEGWKEYSKTDAHYCEGARFEAFDAGGKRMAIALCGDLWTDGRPEEMHALGADVVLWPVWCDYKAEEWNGSINQEYAEQAALCGDCVLLVNPYCADPGAEDCAAGGAAFFAGGRIVEESPAGKPSVLVVEL